MIRQAFAAIGATVLVFLAFCTGCGSFVPQPLLDRMAEQYQFDEHAIRHGLGDEHCQKLDALFSARHDRDREFLCALGEIDC